MDQKAAVGWGPDGYLRPDQFLDHLTVITTTTKTKIGPPVDSDPEILNL